MIHFCEYSIEFLLNRLQLMEDGVPGQVGQNVKSHVEGPKLKELENATIQHLPEQVPKSARVQRVRPRWIVLNHVKVDTYSSILITNTNYQKSI